MAWLKATTASALIADPPSMASPPSHPGSRCRPRGREPDAWPSLPAYRHGEARAGAKGPVARNPGQPLLRTLRSETKGRTEPAGTGRRLLQGAAPATMIRKIPGMILEVSGSSDQVQAGRVRKFARSQGMARLASAGYAGHAVVRVVCHRPGRGGLVISAGSWLTGQDQVQRLVPARYRVRQRAQPGLCGCRLGPNGPSRRDVGPQHPLVPRVKAEDNETARGWHG